MKDNGEQHDSDIGYLGWVLTGSAQFNNNNNNNTDWK